MLHIYWYLANDLPLLHKDAEGQRASETLLHTGRKRHIQRHVNEVVITR